MSMKLLSNVGGIIFTILDIAAVICLGLGYYTLCFDARAQSVPFFLASLAAVVSREFYSRRVAALME
jgi:hypothetical protein